MSDEATTPPATETSRYEPLIGTWRTSGEVLDDGGEVVGRVEGWDLYDRLGDTFIVHRVSVDMDGEQVRAVEIIGPGLRGDAAATRAFGHDGSEEVSSSVVEADRVFTFGSEGARARMEVAEDGATASASWERSDDGGSTWSPWMRLCFVRQADHPFWP